MNDVCGVWKARLPFAQVEEVFGVAAGDNQIVDLLGRGGADQSEHVVRRVVWDFRFIADLAFGRVERVMPFAATGATASVGNNEQGGIIRQAVSAGKFGHV